MAALQMMPIQNNFNSMQYVSVVQRHNWEGVLKYFRFPHSLHMHFLPRKGFQHFLLKKVFSAGCPVHLCSTKLKYPAVVWRLFTTYGYYMKTGCDFQSPERSKNKIGVWHIYHVKLHPSLNPPVDFSWKESYRYYCYMKERKRLASKRE